MRISDWSSDVFSSDLLGLARDRRRRNQPPRSRYLANREDDARANLSRRGLGRFTSDVRSEVAVVITADDKIEIGAPGPPELTDRKQVLGGECDDRGRIAGAMHSMHRDRKSTRLNSSHSCATSMRSSALKKKTNST